MDQLIPKPRSRAATRLARRYPTLDAVMTYDPRARKDIVWCLRFVLLALVGLAFLLVVPWGVFPDGVYEILQESSLVLMMGGIFGGWIMASAAMGGDSRGNGLYRQTDYRILRRSGRILSVHHLVFYAFTGTCNRIGLVLKPGEARWILSQHFGSLIENAELMRRLQGASGEEERLLRKALRQLGWRIAIQEAIARNLLAELPADSPRRHYLLEEIERYELMTTAPELLEVR